MCLLLAAFVGHNELTEDVSLLMILVPVTAIGTLVLYLIRSIWDEPINAWARYFLIPLVLLFLAVVLLLSRNRQKSAETSCAVCGCLCFCCVQLWNCCFSRPGKAGHLVAHAMVQHIVPYKACILYIWLNMATWDQERVHESSGAMRVFLVHHFQRCIL